MAGSYRIVGAEDLRRCADDLRKAARSDLRKELLRGITRAVVPIRKAVRAAAGRVLPSGYAPTLLASPLQLRAKTRTSQVATVTVTATAKGKSELRDVAAMDRGILRHPLFANRDFWYTTRVRAGFVTDTVQDGRPAVQAEIGEAINVVVAKLERG